MKKILFFLSATLFSINGFNQSSWSYGTDRIYGNTINAKLGIGVTAPSKKVQFGTTCASSSTAVNTLRSDATSYLSNPGIYLQGTWDMENDPLTYTMNFKYGSTSGSQNINPSLSTTTAITFQGYNKRIGIGATNPSASLDIYDGTGIKMRTSTQGWLIYDKETVSGRNFAIENLNGSGSSFYPLSIHYSNSYIGIHTTSPSNVMSVNGTLDATKIGIGTTCIPGSYELAVNGEIKAKQVDVSTSSWCDYVLNNDYKLMSIEELEKFISDNNHLPDVPSESEVVENGYSLGKMDEILLKKIEELTLYLIEQNKRIESQQKVIELLHNQK